MVLTTVFSLSNALLLRCSSLAPGYLAAHQPAWPACNPAVAVPMGPLWPMRCHERRAGQHATQRVPHASQPCCCFRALSVPTCTLTPSTRPSLPLRMRRWCMFSQSLPLNILPCTHLTPLRERVAPVTRPLPARPPGRGSGLCAAAQLRLFARQVALPRRERARGAVGGPHRLLPGPQEREAGGAGRGGEGGGGMHSGWVSIPHMDGAGQGQAPDGQAWRPA